uniref:Uncharacterized protein n=1 Tax=Brassica oleracea var. oleracea TaxID=109376 RepID=A0A0D2ZX88_BRAOL
MVRNHSLQKIGSNAERRIEMVIYAESGVGLLAQRYRPTSGNASAPSFGIHCMLIVPSLRNWKQMRLCNNSSTSTCLDRVQTPKHER